MPPLRCAVVNAATGLVENVVIADPASYQPPDGCALHVVPEEAAAVATQGASFDAETGQFVPAPPETP